MIARTIRRFGAGGALALLSSILSQPIDARAFPPPTIYRQALDGPAATTAGTPRFFSINSVMAKIGQTQDDLRIPIRGTSGFVAESNGGFVERRVITPDTPFSSRGFQLFGPLQNRVDDKWQSIRENWIIERLQIGFCERSPQHCSVPVQIFTDILHEAVSRQGADRLNYINSRVNASVSYQSDLSRFGTADVWGTPLATLGQSGDCEDYAITKYLLLAESGQDENDMRILLVRDTRVGEDHAVLAVRMDGAWRVLDNRWNQIETDVELYHYGPMFALSATGTSVFAFSEAKADDPTSDDFLPSSSGISDATAD